MYRYALPTALAAALWTAALAPSQAQDKTDLKKPTTAGQAAPNPNAPLPALPPRPSDPNIVGSVSGKNIMFSEVVDRLRKVNPDAFKQIAGQAAGAVVADQMFGAETKPSVTVTSEQVMLQLRDKSNGTLYQVLQSMLREQAISQQAAKENIVVTDAQINEFLSKFFADMRKGGQIPPKMSDDEFLASKKQTRAGVNDQVRLQLQITKLMEKDAAMQKDLQDNAVKVVGHAPTPGDYVRARHILVATSRDQSANPADAKAADAAALSKINKIAAEIRSGKKTFEAEAQENSDDPGSKISGGDLGVFLRGTMIKEFNQAAFTAKPGEIIGPIKTNFGYHLIKVEKQGKDLTPEERQTALNSFNQRYEQQNPQVVQTFMQNLLEKKAQVVTYMTPPPPAPQAGFPGAPQGG